MKRNIVWAMVLALILLMPRQSSLAEEEYSITVIKKLNRGLQDGTYVLEPVVGSPIELYRAGDESKEDWDKKDFSKLVPFQVVKTNEEGVARFTGLEKDCYYIRDASKTDPIGLSSLLCLPLEENEEAVVYMKVHLPPPENPPDNPPETPPDNPPETPPDNPPDEPPSQDFVKVDAKTKEALSGAAFKVYSVGDKGLRPYKKEGKDLILRSGDNGQFKAELPEGSYVLVETITPVKDGVKYRPLGQKIPFTINASSASKKMIQIENIPVEPGKPPTTIPKTGDIQAFLYFFGGMGLVMVGLYHYRQGRLD